MNDIYMLVVTAAISGVFSILVAFATTAYQLKKERKIERERENESIRIKYLHPLLVATQDLLERVIDIRRRRVDEDNKREMMPWFKKIKSSQFGDTTTFEYWANDEGYFAVSTLYRTAVYYYYASKIRREFPFIELNHGDNIALLYHLSDVRISIGGKFGIWETIQDALGFYLATGETSDKIKNYRDFCKLLADKAENAWFNRLIDFYRDIDLKLEDQFENIQSSLKNLIDFLSDNLDIKRTEYQITEDTLTELKKKDIEPEIVQRMLANLEKIKGVTYRGEIDFSDALINTIGLKYADDYKPSIFRHAKKK